MQSSNKIPEKYIQEYMKVYEAFCDKLSKDAYISLIEKTNWEDGNILRAASLLLLSKKCVQCERTLALALLCFSIEAMTPKASQITFFSWLKKNTLEELVMKTKSEISTNLELAQNEWLKEPQREGAFHNFKQFLLEYCPDNLKASPPVESLQLGLLPFEKVLENIYGEFRSMFVHEGLSYASIDVGNRKIDNFSISHLIVSHNHVTCLTSRRYCHGLHLWSRKVSLAI